MALVIQMAMPGIPRPIREIIQHYAAPNRRLHAEIFKCLVHKELKKKIPPSKYFDDSDTDSDLDMGPEPADMRLFELTTEETRLYFGHFYNSDEVMLDALDFMPEQPEIFELIFHHWDIAAWRRSV